MISAIDNRFSPIAASIRIASRMQQMQSRKMQKVRRAAPAQPSAQDRSVAVQAVANSPLDLTSPPQGGEESSV